ncbi:MAG TPA: ATP-dependent helicase C-terminal domain-containing protein, partial [Ilumatobacteraceae bacterium]|nr:ATP-dependent helicase C-terminal domain-containing protein [Ilumatobacteraceae bacterium]
GDLVERVERRLGSMRLDEQLRRPSPGEETTTALIERLRQTRLRGLDWSAAATRLRERVRFLRQSAGDTASNTPGSAPSSTASSAGEQAWPDWSDKGLVDTLETWLAPYLHGITSMADVATLDLTMILRAGLAWPLGQQLDELAPPTLTLASGRSVTVDYSGEQPSAAVRVQDLFGTATHPTVAGRAVLLHLLSPADPDHRRPARLLGRFVGRGAQGDGRSLPQAPMAGRPGHRNAEALEVAGPVAVTRSLRYGRRNTVTPWRGPRAPTGRSWPPCRRPCRCRGSCRGSRHPGR